ncbi:hypothetical protein PAUR_a1195 [Pseudoalteromonas aurantia 208]|uniref:Secreted protein n=1 Tax=Pseudoalteromonas aurantia 208 TaxID=1314867 RepID=A0ABR9EAA8_9GAMM|nr:hypothetical protein [Pseudoalteromonas aurantia 208]
MPKRSITASSILILALYAAVEKADATAITQHRLLNKLLIILAIPVVGSHNIFLCANLVNKTLLFCFDLYCCDLCVVAA